MKATPSEQPRTPVRAMTRRGLLTAVAGGVVLRSGAQTPAIVTSKNRVEVPGCMLVTEQTEGPYYVDDRLIRRDITEGRPGIALRLEVVILDGRRCTPVQNAAVSLWHCDASGVYSGFTGNSPDGPPGMRGRRPPRPPMGGGLGPPGAPPPFHHGPVDKTRFFRGVQLSDATGTAEFQTIYPGWYMGRDKHIHLKVYTRGSAQAGNYEGGHVCHTGQLFFPDDMSDAVARLPPYAQHHTERARQQEDDIFTSQHGSDFILALVQSNRRNMTDGFAARVVMGVDPDAEPAPTGFGGRPAASMGRPLSKRLAGSSHLKFWRKQCRSVPATV